ncbi:unnamed protein product [Trichobilharzia regenti]|nr:unnamed protein product [Trichobilharzia regenti]
MNKAQLLPTSSSKLDSTHSSRDSSNEANETVSSGQGRHSFKIELTNGHLDDEITHYSKISGVSYRFFLIPVFKNVK